ncbi:MAG: hypothetical protein IJM54_06295 [Thermoguttaceae bacterium]|nr:hypothetical protein [Thermoguttaceae bacterium]
MNRSQDLRRRRAYDARKFGYTLLEIMTSVTLALMLMYSVAKIFSRVGGEMNDTMSTMEMQNALRNAKNRLTADLEGLSVSPEPPRNSRMNEGYLCYVEGMGGPFNVVASNTNAAGNMLPFSTSDVALDTERYEAYDDNVEYNSDNTIGDLDDILSFTAKAPDGQPFRGRYIKPIYDVNGVIVDGEISVFESQYAEIVWFVRGTTLYRRVLPLLSNQQLQESFQALQQAVFARDSGAVDPDELSGVAYENVRRGYGFYYFYDVSVHIGPGGSLVANTLGDLTNRENRYFYWNSVGLRAHPDDPDITLHSVDLHGADGAKAWYWLRMATLQESAAPNFRAGAPFGEDDLARDSWIVAKNNGGSYVGPARQLYGAAAQTTSDLIASYWKGVQQTLEFTTDGVPGLVSGNYSAAILPQPGRPFIDYWNNPNVWNELNSETGDLSASLQDMASNTDGYDKSFNQDVILTNVISFNVKIWDKNANAYVDLGACDGQNSPEGPVVVHNDPSDFRSYGRYGNFVPGGVKPWLPCVYDTWCEQYQSDLCLYDDIQYQKDNTYAYLSTAPVGDIPAEGKIESSQLKDYPPPYDQRADSIQIELRVFDPRSKHIRNATFNVDLSRI